MRLVHLAVLFLTVFIFLILCFLCQYFSMLFFPPLKTVLEWFSFHWLGNYIFNLYGFIIYPYILKMHACLSKANSESIILPHFQILQVLEKL